MRRTFSRIPARHYTTSTVFAVFLCMGFAAPAQAGEESGSGAAGESQADEAVVVPYETRPAPTHRVDLHDDRVYFLKKLEQKDDLYVLHTLEGEVIEVEAANIAEIVELKNE